MVNDMGNSLQPVNVRNAQRATRNAQRATRNAQ
jgi:hypothetical protein